MITDGDLQKIRGVVREEITEVKYEIFLMHKRLDALEMRVTLLVKEVRSIKNRLTQVEKDVSYILKTHDEEIKDVRVRVGSLEKHPLLRN
jgi:predicted  nucleic acid-binding Zn-ribbon protein